MKIGYHRDYTSSAHWCNAWTMCTVILFSTGHWIGGIIGIVFTIINSIID